MIQACYLLIIAVALVYAFSSTVIANEIASEEKDFQLLQQLHQAIADLPQFDPKQATKLVKELEDKSLLNVPVFSQIPLLHHLLNLYFRSSDPNQRRALVELIRLAIENGADVDQIYGNDPSVLMKSLIIRELDLSTLISSKSSSTSGRYDQSNVATIAKTFVQVYNVPCEPVPLMKLLLHADTLIRSHENGHQSFGGVEGIKRLLLGAAPGAGAKPTVKMADLLHHSRMFSLIVNDLGISDSQSIALRQVVESLDELAARVHRQLISKFIHVNVSDPDFHPHQLEEKYEIFSVVLSYQDEKMRNIFHYLAVSGGSAMIRDLTYALQQILKSEIVSTQVISQFQLRIISALSAVDNRGHLPYHYAALRYGTDSSSFKILQELYESFHEVIPLDQLKLLFPSTNNGKKQKSCDDAELCIHQDPVDVTIKNRIKSTYHSNVGGWNNKSLLSTVTGDIERCDIEEVWGIIPSPEEFYEKYLRNGIPVIFRGVIAVDSNLRKAFSFDSFVKKYGNEAVPISTIPYAGSFGVKSSMTTLSAIANVTGEPSEMGDISSIPPSYVFSTAHPSWQKKLQADVSIPSFVQFIVGNKVLSESLGNIETQFYLGPAGSGAPIHFHGHAVNSLAYGEKKWFLYPPSDSFYSTIAALDFILNDPRIDEAKQCTQQAGDIIYVPTLWGHATLNVKQSIGVAHEFSVESFCME